MIKKLFITVSGLLLLTGITFAQNKNEKAVADAVEQLRLAMVNADKTALENIAAEKLSYGHSSGVVQDKKTFVEKIVNGESGFVSIDLSDQTISISGDVALVRHLFKAKTDDIGRPPGEANIKILLVWQKQKGKWKLLARQAVRA